MADMLSESETVESGCPLRTHGSGFLGEIEIPCDGTIAGQIWGAGGALGQKLLDEGLPDRPEVVEVGSGTGIAGIAAAVAGASRVVLTDLPEAIPRLRDAIQRNEALLEGVDISAAPLEWGDTAAAEEACGPNGCDIVLAADVLYSGEASVHAALRAAFVALAQPRDAVILHAYEERWPEVIALWKSCLTDGGPLRLVRRTELKAPPSIRGRSLVLEELRISDDYECDEEEEAALVTAQLLEASRAARAISGF